MKCGELFNKHFCKKKTLLSPNDLAEISNLHFSHYKSMKPISCHSNQSSYPTEIKKNHKFCRGQCPKQVCQVSASSSLQFLRRRILKKKIENLHFMSPRQPIKSSDLDKRLMKHRGLFNKHFCKKIYQISLMTWQKLSISTFPIISLWKL